MYCQRLTLQVNPFVELYYWIYKLLWKYKTEECLYAENFSMERSRQRQWDCQGSVLELM